MKVFLIFFLISDVNFPSKIESSADIVVIGGGGGGGVESDSFLTGGGGGGGVVGGDEDDGPGCCFRALISGITMTDFMVC